MADKLKPGPIGRSYDQFMREFDKRKKDYSSYDAWVKDQAKAPKRGQV